MKHKPDEVLFLEAYPRADSILKPLPDRVVDTWKLWRKVIVHAEHEVCPKERPGIALLDGDSCDRPDHPFWDLPCKRQDMAHNRLDDRSAPIERK